MDIHQSPLTSSPTASPPTLSSQSTPEPSTSPQASHLGDVPPEQIDLAKSCGPAPAEVPEPAVADEPPIRVMAFHALLYCDRLFYLEEVEEIRVADAAVYAGRRLHDEVVSLDDETPEHRSVEVSSETWGLFGKMDAVRRRDGVWVAYEHKRGRCRRGDDRSPGAVALATESRRSPTPSSWRKGLGEPVPQARIRYHADNVTVFVEIDDDAVCDLKKAVGQRAANCVAQRSVPPSTPTKTSAPRCSLAPVCLPEEERLAQSISGNDTPDRKIRPRVHGPCFRRGGNDRRCTSSARSRTSPAAARPSSSKPKVTHRQSPFRIWTPSSSMASAR